MLPYGGDRDRRIKAINMIETGLTPEQLFIAKESTIGMNSGAE
jgi:hypothetical protein